MLYLRLRRGGGYKSLISRVSPLSPLNRFQSGFISFVVLNECEGPHCRMFQNFLVTQSLSHLITCQKKRFFASAQNDEKTFPPSGSYQYFKLNFDVGKIPKRVRDDRTNSRLTIQKLIFLAHFVKSTQNQKLYIYPCSLHKSRGANYTVVSLSGCNQIICQPEFISGSYQHGSIISIHSFISKRVSRISTPLFTPEVA